jgi:hypothetical protein
MEKKTILIIILVALIFLSIGFIIGNKTKGFLFSSNNDIIGFYECEQWNGKYASIVIEDDTNIFYLGRKTTYTRERQ